MKLMAIDPGNLESAWCIIDADSRRPLEFAKHDNPIVRGILDTTALDIDGIAIEMVASYGMAVGREVFETCVWAGRFIECAHGRPNLVYRREVKLHHCGQSRAKDSNVRQALVDRFAPGQSNHGKGTKAEPGWFHGFAADVWQAYAIAVYMADQREGFQP